MLSHLKIKIKSMAAESRFIREREESILGYARFIGKARRHFRHGLSVVQDNVETPHPDYVARPDRPVHEFHMDGQAVVRPEDSEARRHYEEFWGLRRHRTHELRKAARAAHLAYSFLRGHAYKDIEKGTFSPPNWAEIERLALKFAEERPQVIKQRLAQWMEEAADYFEKHGFKNALPKQGGSSG